MCGFSGHPSSPLILLTAPSHWSDSIKDGVKHSSEHGRLSPLELSSSIKASHQGKTGIHSNHNEGPPRQLHNVAFDFNSGPASMAFKRH